MAYVPGYRYDIFVSHAHVDDKPLPGAGKGWVANLVDAMEVLLAQQLGRADPDHLWMDPRLSGNEPLTDQIMTALDQSGVLLVILSPGYVASDWCLREKNEFLRRMEQVVARSRSRVFVVERDQVEDAKRPAEFRDLLPYRFWRPPERGKPQRILGFPAPDPAEKEYYDRLNELAIAIVRELQSLKTASATGSVPLQPRQSVFLAEVTDDLDLQRDEVKRYLDQLEAPGQPGIHVLPEKIYPADPVALKREMERDLAECKLFVQLLSEAPGKKRPDLPKGIVQFQYELAKAAGKEILQWCPPTTNIDAVGDADHKQFLRLGTVRKEGVEGFKKFVRDRAYAKPEPLRPKTDAFVFVDSEANDMALAREIFDELVRYDQGAKLPRKGGTPREMRQDLERNLTLCNALIIVYGTSTAAWVGEQLMQCRKVLQKRDSDLLALAVYQGPPEAKEPLDIALPKMRLIDCRDGFSPERLRSFIDGVAAGT
jgi:hypothetical protein